MIIRERSNEVVMIKQNDHAQISGMFASNWKEDLFPGEPKRNAVELAVAEHDRGWIHVDNKPKLNEITQLPFSFMDYPVAEKLIFYKSGIDEVERMDPYACLLCSYHYSRFVERSENEQSIAFMKEERDRQYRLKNSISNYNEKIFQFHLDLLVFCDNLSLYACLNEPGVSKAREHRFYKKGIPISSTFTFLKGDYLQCHWENQQTIFLSEFPFKESFTIEIKQKVVPKKDIIEKGLPVAYEQAAMEIVPVRLTR